ncbi:MAG: hypothetical protein JWM32_1107 [Verrucomicrobia bacterium]|nr:hypothetical protein [Verrucomicrobiota bacterium]
MKFHSFLSLGFTALLLAVPALAADTTTTGLAGKWKLDVARSTPIRPWDTMSVEIAATDTTATVTRHLAWGTDRKVNDVTKLVTDGKTSTANPVGYWLDTWYTNIYIGADHQKHVTGEWLDGGRILKLETNLSLEGQQGDHPVHVYDEFRLSADGRTLKLYELRSTRDEAMVYIFTRE